MKDTGGLPRMRPTNPFQIPEAADNADIIMALAQKKWQDQKLKSQALSDLTRSLTDAASLYMAKKRSEAQETTAKATLELHQNMLKKEMIGPEEAMLITEANFGPEATPEQKSDMANRLVGKPREMLTNILSKTVTNAKTGEVMELGPRGSILKQDRMSQSEDPNRLLTTIENEQYGTPGGTRLGDVIGKVPMSSTTRQSVNKPEAAANLLSTLEGSLQDLELGPTTGKAILRGAQLTAQAKVPSTKAAQFEAARQNIGMLIKGFGDTGALAEGDVQRGQKSLPGFFDTPQSAIMKSATLTSILRKAQESAARSSGARAGVDIKIIPRRNARQILEQLNAAGVSKKDAVDTIKGLKRLGDID